MPFGRRAVDVPFGIVVQQIDAVLLLEMGSKLQFAALHLKKTSDELITYYRYEAERRFLNCLFPVFVIPPRSIRSPLECSLGTRPR